MRGRESVLVIGLSGGSELSRVPKRGRGSDEQLCRLASLLNASANGERNIFSSLPSGSVKVLALAVLQTPAGYNERMQLRPLVHSPNPHGIATLEKFTRL
jgi:hypothetical protein